MAMPGFTAEMPLQANVYPTPAGTRLISGVVPQQVCSQDEVNACFQKAFHCVIGCIINPATCLPCWLADAPECVPCIPGLFRR